MKEKQQNMTLKDYLNFLKNSLPSFRDEFCTEFGISVEAFYYKVRNDSWTKPEKKYLAEKTGIPKNILFPESKKVA